MTRTATNLVLALAVAATGCLDELADDEPGFSDRLIPPGADIPPIEDDALLVAQIRSNDGLRAPGALISIDGDPEVRDTVPLRSAFAGSMPVNYYDFGVAPNDVAAALYVFIDESNPTELVVDHPFLVDAIPGDPGYSPFFSVYLVPVTTSCDPADLPEADPRLDGPCRPFFEGDDFWKIPSRDALTDARDLGLIGEPVPLGAAFEVFEARQLFVNAPVVRPGLQLQITATGAVESEKLAARGFLVDAFFPSMRFTDVPAEFADTGDPALDQILPLVYELGAGPLVGPPPRGSIVPRGNVYVVREPNDVNPIPGNNVFQTGPNPAPTTLMALFGRYTPLVRKVDVVVSDPTGVDAEADLFTRDMAGQLAEATMIVVEFELTEDIFNWPLSFR